MVKFRSWCESLEMFFYFYNGLYFQSLEEMQEYIEKEKNKYKLDYVGLSKGLFNWQNAEQSTGLFDKNGKEIYINDKIKWRNYKGHDSYYNYEGTVKQEKYGAYFAEMKDGTTVHYVWNKPEDMEIIGNIHEGEK